jgi:hypothetical protein
LRSLVERRWLFVEDIGGHPRFGPDSDPRRIEPSACTCRRKTWWGGVASGHDAWMGNGT